MALDEVNVASPIKVFFGELKLVEECFLFYESALQVPLRRCGHNDLTIRHPRRVVELDVDTSLDYFLHNDPVRCCVIILSHVFLELG